MRLKQFAILASALTCMGLVATDAMAQRRDNDRRAGKWVELGCQQVSFIGKDRDSIRVGRSEGRFKAIKLAARGNDVEMLDLKVIYANGEPDDIPVRSLIRAGRETRRARSARSRAGHRSHRHGLSFAAQFPRSGDRLRRRLGLTRSQREFCRGPSLGAALIAFGFSDGSSDGAAFAWLCRAPNSSRRRITQIAKR